MYLETPFVPRDGQTLRVILPARVSDPRPGKQNRERSLGDQESIQRRWLTEHVSGPYETKIVAGSGSGENVTRVEYRELMALVKSDRYDLLVVEDLGRIARRVESFWFCELCEDHQVRLIAINNNIDTQQPGWRDTAFFAAYFYEKDNNDKSRRLKERLRMRFEAGCALERRIFGYIDDPGAKHESQRHKDDKAEVIYKEWFERLSAGATYTEIADWLNEKGVPVGPYCRGSKWDSKMVWRNTHNPILKGHRRRGVRKTRRVNGSGKYVSRRADANYLLQRECPHLAFFTAEHFNRVTQAANANNAKFKPGKDGHDPRRGRPKKKTAWPGQHVYCGVCGRLYRYGGHGQNQRLMCRGAYEYKCWNGITLDGPLAAKKLSAAILERFGLLPDFDQALQAELQVAATSRAGNYEQERTKLDRRQADVVRKLNNVTEAIAENGTSEALREKLRSLEREQCQLAAQKCQLDQCPPAELELPGMPAIRELARSAFQDLAVTSAEYSTLIRRLVTRIVAWPVQSLRGGTPYLRAGFVLQLAPLVPETRYEPKMARALSCWMQVDLFEPTQIEAYRTRIMEEIDGNSQRKQPLTQRQIAKQLGITLPVVQQAVQLQRRMDELQLDDPYRILEAPPAESRKFRRHQHKRYEFRPHASIDLY